MSKNLVEPVHLTENDSDIESDIESDADYSDTFNVVGNEKYVHPFTKNEYSVLVEKYLQKDKNILDMDIEYKIHICIYKVILYRDEPYLLYLLNKNENDNIMEFPSYVFNFNSIADSFSTETIELKTGENTEANRFDLEFDDKMFQEVRKYMQGGESIQLESVFRGFHVITSDIPSFPNSEIVVVFDATYLPIDSNHMVSASIYELLCVNKIMEYNLAPYIPKFFIEIQKQNDTLDFHHIVDINHQKYVESPYCLFLCRKDQNGNYVSVSSLEYKDSITSLIFGKINHPYLGSQIMLSHFPLGNVKDPQRILLFSKNKNIAFIEGDMTLDMVLSDDVADYSAVTYFENETQLWAVESISFVEALIQ